MNSTNSTPRALTILGVITCLIAAGIAQASFAGPVQIAISKSDDTGFQASLDLSEPDLSLVSTKAGEFVEAGWPGAGKSCRVGKPALPVLRKLFLAPLGAELSLEAAQGQAVVIDLGQKLMPIQPPIEKLPGAMQRAVFQLDAKEYARNEYGPEERVVIEEVGIVRGHRLFLLEMRPVSYNPDAGKIKFWPRLSAEVSFKGGVKGPGRAVSVMQGLDGVVLNPQMLPGDAMVSANYLIVVAEAFETAIEPFVTAKQAQGYTVTTYSVSPGAANTTIKSYIQGLWGAADAPDYILLVGDTDTIPNWRGGGEEKPNTDLPYACMDAGDDWYPDIAIGRFPVRSTAQLADVVNKTLAFEDGLYADNEYLARAVFMASADNYIITETTHNWVIENYMTPYEIASDKLYCHTYHATTQQVADAFNNGRLYGVYSGHGGENYWADGPVFYQSDVRNLTNTDLYPFVFSFACVTGSYMLPECFAETWLLTADKGAVAIYASSVTSYWTEDDQLERCLFQTLFDDDIREIGPCWNAARMRYLTAMGAGATTRRYFEMYNLMGDPSAYVPPPTPGTGLRVSPRTDLESTGPEGGPFTPAGTVYTLENQNETPINFEITADQPWVLIDTPAGYLEGFAAVDVTVSIGIDAWTTMGVGRYQAQVSFVNTTDHDGDTTRHVTLDIGTPTVQYSWNMDANPGWKTTGQWAWGQPTGGGGEHGGPDPTSGYTGNNVYGYNLNGDYPNNMQPSFLATVPINCSNLTRVSLRFQRWLGVENNAYDHATIQVSNDRINWTTIWENQSSDISDAAWTLQEFDISEVADGQPQVFIRWTMGPTDGSYRFCGWNIDDVEILAVRPEPSAPITQTIIDVQNTTVAPGEPVGPVTVEVTNNTDASYQYVEKPYVVQPGGNTIWLKPKLRSLPAGATKRSRFPVRTTPSFVEGQYTYGILLTDTVDNEIDNDSFTFNVVVAAGS
ncbi:MAG TPA: C25 family cysteine peptidase [Sedimentisphaerales bacterium]|nr:C25 family cysteine peptidase [Sedimentisphaerales bacterium]